MGSWMTRSAQWSPAGIGAVEHWLKGRFQDHGIVLAPRKEGAQGKSMSHGEILAMLKRGIETEPGPLKSDGKEYDLLSHGFSGGADNSRELDRRLAAVMSLRQVPPAGWRQLSMGTVVIQMREATKQRPYCASHRDAIAFD